MDKRVCFWGYSCEEVDFGGSYDSDEELCWVAGANGDVFDECRVGKLVDELGACGT